MKILGVLWGMCSIASGGIAIFCFAEGHWVVGAVYLFLSVSQLVIGNYWFHKEENK